MLVNFANVKGENGQSRTVVNSPGLNTIKNTARSVWGFLSGKDTIPYKPTAEESKLIDEIKEYLSADSTRKVSDAYSAFTDQFGKDSEVLKRYMGEIQEETSISIEGFSKYATEIEGLGTSIKTVATKGLNILANAGIDMAIGIGIQLLISGIDNLIHAQENAIEKGKEASENINSLQQGLQDMQSFVSNSGDEFHTLAQGVDEFGNNIGLNSNQFERYNELTNQIAEMFPTLVKGYTETGNAIIKNADAVNTLNQAYNEQAESARKELITQGNTVFESAQAEIFEDDAEMPWTNPGLLEQVRILETILGLTEDLDRFSRWANAQASVQNRSDITARERDYVFGELGFDAEEILNNPENLEQYRQQIVAMISKIENEIPSKIADVKTTIQAAIEDLYDFKTLDESSQQAFDRVFQSLDASYYSQFESYETAVANIQNDILARIKDNPQITDAINGLFTISPDNMSAADYQSAIDQYIQELSNAGFSDEIIAQIKVGFEIETYDNAERDEQIKQVGDRIGATVDEIKARFSETEISVLISPDFQFVATNIDDLKAEIQSISEVSEALSNMESTGDSLRTSLNSVTADLENYALISDVVNGKVYLTEEQMLSLVRAMPELQQYLQRTSQGWILEEGAMDSVNSAVGSLEDSYVSAQLAMSRVVAQQAAQRLGITENEFNKIQGIAGAYMEIAAKMGGPIPVTVDENGVLDYSNLPKDQQVVLSYFSNLETLNKAQDTLDQTSLFDGEAEKAAEEQAKALEDYNEAIADAAKNYQETVKDAEERYNETLKDLDEEQYNADFKYQIDSITESLQAYADQLDILSESLDGYYKTDIVGKMSNITEQYQLQAQYSGELKTQMDQLLNTVPESAEAWQELASTLETVSSDYFESQRNLIELRKQMFETAAETIGAMAEESTSAMDAATDNLDRMQDIMERGSFAYSMYDLPKVRTMDPEAVRNQRKENKMLEDEEQEYQEKVTEIRKRAVDEQKAYEDQERQTQREEALAEYNEALADAKEQYDEALANAQESYESAMESASGRVAATNTSNMINSTSAWVADATNQYDQLKQYCETNGIEMSAKFVFYDPDGNPITDMDAYRAGLGGTAPAVADTSSISQQGTPAVYDGNGTITNEQGSVYGTIQTYKIKNAGYLGTEMKNLKIYPDGSAIWQSPTDSTRWFHAPPGSISYKADGGNTSGLTIVNEEGQEGYLGKDGLLHWFQPGAQMFDAENIVRVFNAEDMQKIVAYTGDKYFREPVGDISSVTQYASGNTSVSFPTTRGTNDIQRGTELSGSSAEKFVEEILEEVNAAFEGLQGSVSVEPIKDTIYKKLSDKRLYSDLGDTIQRKTSDEVDTVSADTTKELFTKILNNSDWNDFSAQVQERLSQLGVTGETWSDWIQDPNNSLQAVQLMQDGSVDSWDMLSTSMQEILTTAGIDSSETWSTYVNDHPLDALILLEDSWDMMLEMISQYMEAAITIATNGANAIHAIAIEAPQISQESWQNLQTLIANKIQEILNVINETFGSATVDLNFGVSLSGNESTNPQGITTGSGAGSNLVATAQQYLGTPYVWGGTTPSGFDCSGFVQYVLAQNGINIKRTTYQQFEQGTAVDRSALSPGDLVFFRGSESEEDSMVPEHVGMYVGNDTFIHAPHTGDVVKYSSLNSNYYAGHYIGARRYYAAGTNAAQPGTALVGDEYLIKGSKHPTPELIFSKKSNRMYLAGLNGAETVKLGAGDVVVPYSETKDILQSTNGLSSIPSFANGTDSFYSKLNELISRITGKRSKTSSASQTQESSQLYQDGYPVEQKGILIDVPDGLGTVYTYEAWDAITNMNTPQGDLIQAAGKNYDSLGYGRIGDRYAVAMTSTFGSIGDYVDIYMSNGRVIHGVIADEKSQEYVSHDHNPANKWGHNQGERIVEWVTNWRGHDNPPSDGEVMYVVNVGNYFGNPSFAGEGNYSRQSILQQKLNEVYAKIQPLLGRYTTNTDTGQPRVAAYRSLGSSRGSYDFATPFTRYASGTGGAEGGLSLVGEQAPEYAVFPNGKVEKLGKHGAELVDLPRGTRILNASQTSTVDRYTGGIDGTHLHRYEEGTGEEITVNREEALTTLNEHLDEQSQLTKEILDTMEDSKIVSLLDAIEKYANDDHKYSLSDLESLGTTGASLDAIMESYYNGEYEDKLFDIINAYTDKVDEITSRYEAAGAENDKRYREWLQNGAVPGAGMAELQSILDESDDLTSGLLRETNQAGISYGLENIKLLQEYLEPLEQLYDMATTADEKALIQEEIDAVQSAIDDVNDSIIQFYEADRERILAEIDNIGFKRDGEYGTGISYLEKSAEDLSQQIEDSDDQALQYDLRGDLADIYGQEADRLAASMNEFHNNLNELREDPVYGEIFSKYPIDEIFDANGEFNDLYHQITDQISRESPELLQAWLTATSAAQANKQGYLESQEGYEEAVRNQNEVIEEQQLQKMQAYLDLQDRLTEILDSQIERQNALMNAKQQLYSLSQTLREESAEIENQLKANKHLSEWLDPKERELLFNESDYSKEMDVIESIQDEANQLYDDYYNKISNLNEEDLWQEAELTAEYERQMEVLNERLEIAKQDLAIAKKRTEYANALQERDTQVFMGNRAVNIADPDTLYNLSMELSELETNKENTLQTNAENEDIRDMERVSGEWENERAAIQNRVDMINSMTEAEQAAFSQFLEPFDVLYARLQSFTYADPFYMITTDNTSDVYRNWVDYGLISQGYSLTTDIEGTRNAVSDEQNKPYPIENIKDWNLVKEYAGNRHDRKTLTDPNNQGYTVHGNSPNATEGTYILPVYDNIEEIDPDAPLPSKPSTNDYRAGTSTKLSNGTTVTTEGTVVADLELPSDAAISADKGLNIILSGNSTITTDDNGNLVISDPSGNSVTWHGISLSDIGLSGYEDGSIYNPNANYVPDFSAALDRMYSMEYQLANFLVGNSQSLPQDNSTTYNIDNIYVTDPVPSADELITDLTRQARGQFKVNNNTR